MPESLASVRSLLPRKLIALVLTGALAGTAPAQERVDYLKEIKPLLREKCFACHGALKQKAKLRLDTAALAKQGGRGGPAVRPGTPDKSLLIERVTATDAADRMPPDSPPLTPVQIAKLRAWIAQGAPAPANEQPESDPREHWAFRVPVRRALPMVKDPEWAHNPIDAFLAAEHASHGVKPRPAVERSLLLRRVYLDLIGLPPTSAELQAFLDDPAPDAYERVVDRLLADPRHGERWGRHWMDVWRYSDWYGRRMVPDVWNSAPQLWRWRDWIVRSLNADKGYDRMVQEMLAADEICPEDDAAPVATGFLIRNWYALNPNDWMRSNVEHVGKAFLGLTFNCAHCHDHKYDPILQADYFRLRAYFEPIGIRQDRVPGESDPGPFQEYSYSVLRKVQRLGAVRIFDKNPQAPTWFYTGGDERNRVKEKGPIAPGVPEVFGESPRIEPCSLPVDAYYPALHPAMRAALLKEQRDAVAKAESERAAAKGDTHTVLGKAKVAAAEAKTAAARAALASLEARIAADEAKFAAAPNAVKLAIAAAIADREAGVKAAEAGLLVAEVAVLTAEQGSAEVRAKTVAPAVKQRTAAQAQFDKLRAALKGTPTAYPPLGPTYPKTSTGRRKALAEWITSRANPLAARVAVNHIWMRHFHAPLVASVYDFGRNGARPTHPELLDFLAVEFMEHGWSMKHLHRLIVTSRAYRMSSAQGSGKEAARDPENRLLWRMNVGRMEAEVVRDSLLDIGGMLDCTMGGQELENSQSLTTHRRSLYYSCQPETDGTSEFGKLFDAPDAGECYRRTRTVVPQQALALTNSDLVHEVSAKLARALDARLDARKDPRRFVEGVYERVLSRRPTAAELTLCVEFLSAQGSDGAGRRRESLVRALLNHNDFVTIR